MNEKIQNLKYFIWFLGINIGLLLISFMSFILIHNYVLVKYHQYSETFLYIVSAIFLGMMANAIFFPIFYFILLKFKHISTCQNIDRLRYILNIFVYIIFAFLLSSKEVIEEFGLVFLKNQPLSSNEFNLLHIFFFNIFANCLILKFYLDYKRPYLQGM